MSFRTTVTGVLAMAAAAFPAPSFGNERKAALDEVVVTASPYTSDVSVAGKEPARLIEVPRSISVVTSQRIEDQKLTTIGEALATANGVTVIPNSGTNGQYKARGFQLTAMHDGMPMISTSSGYTQLDVALYERVEILRGPSGMLQGTGDAGGTINLVRKRGQEDFHGSVGATLGSWDDRRITLDVGGPLASRHKLLARGVIVYSDRDHFADHSHHGLKSAYGALDWHASDATTVTFSVAAQDGRDQASYSGVPAWDDGRQLDVPRSTNLTQDWNLGEDKMVDIGAEFRHRFAGGWKVALHVRRQNELSTNRDSVVESGVRLSDKTVPYGRRQSEYEYRRLGVDAFASREITLFGYAHKLLVGFNWENFDTSFESVSLRSARDQIRVPLDHPEWIPPLDVAYNAGGERRFEQHGFYFQAHAALSPRLTFIAGGRLSAVEDLSQSISFSITSPWRDLGTSDDQFTPSAGLVFKATPWASLYASYAESFVPQATLQANGEPLSPRTGEQLELGAKAELLEGRLNLSAAVFKLQDTHRAIADLANPGFSIDAGRVDSEGWEIELVGSPFPGYELQFGYSRLDAEFAVAPVSQQGTRFSALEPKHSCKLWVTRRASEGPMAGLVIGAGVNMQSGIEHTPPRVQGGYVLANLMASYQLNPKVTVSFNANNLLDKTYYARLGGLNSYNAFGPPRNYKLSVGAAF